MLSEHEWQEQDKRLFAYALTGRSGEPFETYDAMRKAAEDMMAPAEPIPPQRRSWYEA